VFWFLAFKLFIESKDIEESYYYLFGIPVFLGIAWHLFTTSYLIGTFPFLVSGLFFSIMVAPFLNKEPENNRIWVFNFSFLFSTALIVAGSLLLWLGIIAIFESLRFLFSMDISRSVYVDVFTVIISLVSPTLVLFFIPKKKGFVLTKDLWHREARNADSWHRSAKEHEESKAWFAGFLSEKISSNIKWIGFFINYIVIPLLLVYSLVLYIYMVKVLYFWNLPKGEIAYLITSFGIIGIVCYLIVHCMPCHKPKKIFQFFKDHFLKVLLAPLLLLAIAIYQRVSAYGVTESRYIILMFFVWLSSSVLFGLFISKDKAPKFIMVSLAVLLLLASMGPLSAIDVSTYSQTHRLKERLLKNHILINGIIMPTKNLAKEECVKIKDALQYIFYSQKHQKIKPWFLNMENAYINHISTPLLTTEEDAFNVAQDMGIREAHCQSQ
jgi:hypothetical protein